MKKVYLTSGPRGSGKSTFTRGVLNNSSGVKLISRDEILIELFGSTSLSPYEGGHYVAQGVVFDRVKECLNAVGDVSLILDYWNGFPTERQRLVRRLKELGADLVICWYFVVPLETCIKWFISKEDVRGYSISSIKWDHSLFYNESSDIDTDGFDQVIRIDPRQLLLPGVSII